MITKHLQMKSSRDCTSELTKKLIRGICLKEIDKEALFFVSVYNEYHFLSCCINNKYCMFSAWFKTDAPAKHLHRTIGTSTSFTIPLKVTAQQIPSVTAQQSAKFLRSKIG